MNTDGNRNSSIVYSQLPLRRGDKGLSQYIVSKVDSDISAESICGDNDSQDVEFYDGSRFVTTEFVNTHQKPVCQIQWNTGLGLKYKNPGNVNGIPWTTGTLIDTDLIITAGHTFDRFPGRYNVPRIDGTENPIYPEEIATNEIREIDACR